MSNIFLEIDAIILVLQKKQENPTIDMAKIQIRSERLTLFGGLFSIMEQFDSTLSSVIDSTLGLRCRSLHFMARLLAMAELK